MALQGSPGISRTRMKTTMTIPISTGIEDSTRRTMYSIMLWAPRPAAPIKNAGGAAASQPHPASSQPARELLTGLLAVKRAPQVVVVFPSPGVADMQRAADVQTHDECRHHVVGVEGRSVVEGHIVSQTAGIDRQVSAWLAAGRQRRVNRHAADLVGIQRL